MEKCVQCASSTRATCCFLSLFVFRQCNRSKIKSSFFIAQLHSGRPNRTKPLTIILSNEEIFTYIIYSMYFNLHRNLFAKREHQPKIQLVPYLSSRLTFIPFVRSVTQLHEFLLLLFSINLFSDFLVFRFNFILYHAAGAKLSMMVPVCRPRGLSTQFRRSSCRPMPMISHSPLTNVKLSCLTCLP